MIILKINKFIMDDNLCSMTLTREYYLEEKKITHDFFIGILKINEEIFLRPSKAYN